jgi:hypothetical protein
MGVCSCDTKSPTGACSAAGKGSVGASISYSKSYKTLREEEPGFKRPFTTPEGRKWGLTYGDIHPDLPGEGTHDLDEAQTKLCMESITGTQLPEGVEFISGRMERKYVFTKERNPIRNSRGRGELVFRIPHPAIGPYMRETVTELKRFDDQNNVSYTWIQWEGKRDKNGYYLEVAPPPLDGNTPFRYMMSVSSDVLAYYFFIYDSAKELFQVEYRYNNVWE